MAKKKPAKLKKVKQEQAKRDALRRVSAEEGRELVEGLIAQGKPREAIQTMQQFPFADTPDFVFLKALAYAHRARQLQGKGMEQESDTVLGLLGTQLSRLGDLECGKLGRIIAASPLPFGLACYRKHGVKHPSCPFLEKALADRMVLEERWEIADELPRDNPVGRDAAVMAEAAKDMAEGFWEEGVARLGSLPRKSPFASWKLFAKAMVSAYNGEEEGLERALKQLPEDFPLRKTVSLLREKGCKGLEDVHGRVSGPDLELADSVVKAIKEEDKQTARLLPQLAKSLYPHNPELALRSLSESTACALAKKGLKFSRIKKFLPSDVPKALLPRLEMFLTAHEDERYSDAFCSALRYLDYFGEEFAHVRSLERVEAAVYYLILQVFLKHNRSPRMLTYRERHCLKEWLGSQEMDTEDLFVALVDKITRLAPDVEEYHKVLGRVAERRLTEEGEKILESVLLRGQESFPEDPDSYLGLAKLYWKRNAYRKSQKILEKAWEKASYDPKVREYYGLGLLRAAMKTRNRRSFDLARKDLAKARELNLKDQVALSHALESTLDFLEKGEKGPVLDSLLAMQSPAVKLRSLVYLWADLDRLVAQGAPGFAREVRAAARRETKSAIKDLSGRELVEIVAPFSRELHYFLGDFDSLEFFGDLWTKILPALNDQEVPAIYAQLLGLDGEGQHRSWIRKDLAGRLRKRKSDVFLRFYSALLDYLDDPETGPAGFERITSGLNEQERKKLSDHCRSIASNFDEPLSDALESFNFELLDDDDDFPHDHAYWLDDEGDDDFDDDDDDDLFDDDEEGLLAMGNPLSAILDVFLQVGGMGAKREAMGMFESLVGMFAAAGADDDALRHVGVELQKKGKHVMDRLRGFYTASGAKSAPRAVMLVLYPDRK